MKSTQNDFLSTLSKGKEEDIGMLYQQVFPKVSRFIVSNNGRTSDAEDIFQKALLQKPRFFHLNFSNRMRESLDASCGWLHGPL